MSHITKDHLQMVLQSVKSLLARKVDKTELVAKISEISKTAEADKRELHEHISETFVPSDWKQNDASAPDFVKNRTHWMQEEISLFFNCCYQTIADANGVGQAGNRFAAHPFIKNDGTEYLVRFDGVEYRCAVAGRDTGRMIGNFYLLKAAAYSAECAPNMYQAPTIPAEAPFALVWSNYYNPAFHVYTLEPGEHTIEVCTITKNFSPLDEGYIPDTIARAEKARSSFLFHDHYTSITTYLSDARLHATIYDAAGDVYLPKTGDVVAVRPTYNSSYINLNNYNIKLSVNDSEYLPITCISGGDIYELPNFPSGTTLFLRHDGMRWLYLGSTAVPDWNQDDPWGLGYIKNKEPLLLDADMVETYLSESSYGDAALKAIKSGRNILVRVPNADGGNHTAIYSPTIMYQLPNYQNKYLHLFFLRDEKQDLSALVDLPNGSVQIPAYGQLKMLLSQEYNSNPMESAAG